VSDARVASSANSKSVRLYFFPAHLEIIQIDFQLCFFHVQTSAGRTTTNEELEEMLEQGNPAVFTQGVRHLAVCSFN
jgi:hypothetical protein